MVIEVEVAARVRTAAGGAGGPTRRVCEVAAMFGIGIDAEHEVQIVPPTKLRLGPGRLAFVTGASGGGKTTLLRLLRKELERRDDVAVLDFERLGEQADDEAALVDRLGRNVEEAVRWLSLAGLNDAAVMLRRRRELSDGQRYRLRLAEAIAAAEAALAEQTHRRTVVVLADEFGATLDRLTAAVVARNVRKWTRRTGGCFVAATTHDDLLEPLEPDTLIVQESGETMRVIERSACGEG